MSFTLAITNQTTALGPLAPLAGLLPLPALLGWRIGGALRDAGVPAAVQGSRGSISGSGWSTPTAGGTVWRPSSIRGSGVPLVEVAITDADAAIRAVGGQLGGLAVVLGSGAARAEALDRLVAGRVVSQLSESGFEAVVRFS